MWGVFYDDVGGEKVEFDVVGGVVGVGVVVDFEDDGDGGGCVV